MSHPEPEDVPDDRRPESFAIEVSDETFTFRSVPLPDRRVTGAQIAAAAGHHQVENFVVLQHLASGELESLRPTELTDLADPGRERFFVIEGDELYRFRTAGLSMEWPRTSLTAEQIIFLAKADEESEVVLHRGDGPADVYEGDDEVQIDLPGVENIDIRKARHIMIFVDGEPYQPPRRWMTPNEIINEATDSNPAETYLARIKPNGEQVNYKDKGDTPIRLRDQMKFIVVSCGPTPVSDPSFEKGVALFMAGLEALGYKPHRTESNADAVVFDYPVQSGRFAGQTVKLGFVVPRDFPLAWPSGPHVSPRLHPNRSGGDHPAGGIHDEQTPAFAQAEGGEWQYWSRPYHHRGGIREPVQAYLGHILKLWDTQ